MSTHNHTAITTGAAANASTINTPLGTLDAAIGNLTTLTTTAKTSAVAAINEVDGDASTAISRIGAAASSSGSIATSIDTDGTLKTGAVDVPSVIADNAIESSNLVHDPYNANYAPSTSTQDGAVRWYNAGNLSQVTPDASNPYSLPTIRTTSATGGGKRIYLSECGLKVDDVISLAVEWLVPTGTTARVIMQFLNSGGSGVTSAFTTRAGNDAVAITKISNQTIPATTASIAIIVRNDSGSGNTDVYAWHLVRGALVRTTGMISESIQTRRHAALLAAAAGSTSALDTRLDVSLNEDGSLKARGLVLAGGYDPLFRVFAPPNTGGSSTKEDDGSRWVSESALALIDDSANPFGTRTLRFDASVASTGGIRVFLSDSGLMVSDVISIGILAKIPATVTARLTVIWRDSGGSSLGTSSSTYAAGAGTAEFLSRTNLTVPASTSYAEIYIQKNAGTDPVDIYGIWISFGPTIAQDDCEAFGYRAKYDIAEMARRGNGDPAIANPGRLTSWMAALADILENAGTANARLAIIGDSITNDPQRGIRQLAARLWADGYANGGVGFYSAYASQYLADSSWNWQAKQGSRTRSGTWTERVPGSTPAARGLDCTEAESTANGDKYTDVMAATTAVCHYLARNGGGQFRYRYDSGSWTTIDTDNSGSDTWAKVELTGLSSASHTFEWEALEAGVIFLGWEYYDDVGEDVVIHKLGHGGAKTTEWRQMAQTDIWQDALANLAPDAVLIHLGTNENQSAISSATYRGYMNDIIDVIQTVLPNADIGLVVPYHTEPTISANRFETTRRWIRQIAVERGLLCIDLSAYMPDATHSIALDLIDSGDEIHATATGGQIIGRVYYDALRL